MLVFTAARDVGKLPVEKKEQPHAGRLCSGSQRTRRTSFARMTVDSVPGGGYGLGNGLWRSDSMFVAMFPRW